MTPDFESGAPARLTAIGFDADDTLWDHERYFQLTQARFAELLRDYADPHHLADHLLAAERRNILHYGFGVKGFMLSMIETAVEVTNGEVPGHVIRQVLKAGRAMLRHPILPMPGAREALEALAKSHTLILITKGDLFDQERKLAASGLREYFTAVEIVSQKDAATYERLFARHGTGAEHAMMVGNSLQSDIVPALKAGAWGIHVPSQHNWALDHDDEPAEQPRFRRIATLSELAPLIAEIG
jgi:putative hydrolase of the HAD superfamily